jgi:hypothetical protein
MVKVRIPEKYRQKVIAFYTDPQRRIRPITVSSKQIQEFKLKERKEEIKERIEVAKKKGSFERSIQTGVPAFRKRKLEIDPLVMDKYYEWVRYSRRWQNRKMLPIGALQKYYESRKAAFIAEGGSPDLFDDAFDKLDMAQAVDSWADLDKELSKHLIFTYKKGERLSQREIERMIREREEEERRLEELYKQYLEEDERRRRERLNEDGMG